MLHSVDTTHELSAATTAALYSNIEFEKFVRVCDESPATLQELHTRWNYQGRNVQDAEIFSPDFIGKYYAARPARPVRGRSRKSHFYSDNMKISGVDMPVFECNNSC